MRLLEKAKEPVEKSLWEQYDDGTTEEDWNKLMDQISVSLAARDEHFAEVKHQGKWWKGERSQDWN